MVTEPQWQYLYIRIAVSKKAKYSDVHWREVLHFCLKIQFIDSLRYQKQFEKKLELLVDLYLLAPSGWLAII